MAITLKGGKFKITMPEQKAVQTYLDLQKAFEFFSAKLFQGMLPHCLITMQRHKGSKGYYSAQRFQNTKLQGDRPDEIALNPQTFSTRTPREIISTLVHEMAHMWQFHFAKAPLKPYHNQEWAAKMVEIGLQPTDTGLPGGKMTGPRITHYIIKGGKFSSAYAEFEKVHATRLYKDVATDKVATSKKAASKTCYLCQECGIKVWGKPDLSINCNTCDCSLEPQEIG